MTGTAQPGVTVLLPTLAEVSRREGLRRALDSIVAQAEVSARATVIVNGLAADPALLAALRRDPSLDLLEVPERGIPGAFRAGRPTVTTPYFAALDDDDVLLPGALHARVTALEADPLLDAVVTNGLIRTASAETRLRPDFADVRRDPIRAMFAGNWLLPGSWLCRSDRVGAWLFEGMPKYRECTWIGLRLATRARVAFLDEPTVAWSSETTEGAHRSLEYCLGQVPAMRQLLTLPLPAEVQEMLRVSIRRGCHEAAHRLLIMEGRRPEAWRWHLRSLRERGGRHHLFFTRKLFYPRSWLSPPAGRGDGPA